MTAPLPARAARLLGAAALLAAHGAAAADANAGGVSDDAVLFGQSAALSGPAEALGTNMRIGIEAAFSERNRSGGVHGRMLELRSLDDAYEPDTAIANTRRLIGEDDVFALIGAVGTPTSRAALPVAAEAGVPYVAPFTGAAFLRDAGGSGANVLNLRASYDDETAAMVTRLVEDLDVQRIAVMYQDDSFGRAGYAGAQRALAARGMNPVSVGVYPRNTTSVKSALLDVRAGKPQAVILVGAYEPVATLISWARHIGFDPVFITISFVGSNALARELGTGGEGVFVTQVVPFPWSTHVPVVSAYADALAAVAPQSAPGFVSLEGYLAGRLAIAALDACGPAPDRECFLGILERRDEVDLGGFTLRYGENDNQGSDQVFLTVIGADGGYHPIASLREVP